ncbi:MAG TPA: YhgE/Pip domain-containing protein [Propionibacteriaceae bacterium]|nr:YhgE/Pip domain-containing protein [Propionibacteriaceae bacterium]
MSIRGMHIERATATGRITWTTLVGLVLVPLVVALGFLATTWHRDARLGSVQGAIVNLDQAVTLDGRTVPLGRQLSAAIVGASGSDNIDWVLTDSSDAQAGLRSGSYAVVVTIPRNFSKAATSTSSNSAAKATQATVSVQTSQTTSVANASIAQEIARSATTTFNASMARTYLDNIYVGYNKVGQQFTTVSKAANQLADGAKGLASGTGSASDGATKLSDGLRQLDAARSQFAGAQQLVTSGGRLSTGATSLATGAGALSTGLSTMNQGMPALTQGVAQLDSGASQLAAGIAQFESKVSSGSADFSQLTQLQQGATQVASGAAGVSGGLTTVDQTLQSYASGKVPASSVLPAGTTEQVAQGCTAALTKALTDQLGAGAAAAVKVLDAAAPQVCGGTFQQGFQAGTGVGTAALNTKDATSGMSLLEAASAVSTGAGQVSSGVDQLATQLPQQARAQQQQLADGLAQLKTGADQLAAGTSQLHSNTGKLASGVTQSATGAQQLASGATGLASGVGQYVTGVDQLVGGMQKYADGVSQAAAGSSSLADGLGQLSTGSDKLSSGLTQFADGLSKGARQVPSYSATDRAKLATVAAQPVAQTSALPSAPLVASTLVLSVLALWLGALATFLVVRPVPSRVLTSSRSSLGLVWATVAPGTAVAAVQAVLLGAVDAYVLDLSLTRGLTLTALLVVVGLAFVAVNHALAAWLGGVGRLLSLVVVTLAAAAGLSSAVPGWFTAVTSFTPIAPALAGVRGVVAGVSNLSGPVAWLVLWLVLAAIASILSVVRHRQLSASGYRRQLAASEA